MASSDARPSSVDKRPSAQPRAVEFATPEWIDWSNNCKLLESIGNNPTAEAEQSYNVVLAQAVMAAYLILMASANPARSKLLSTR